MEGRFTNLLSKSEISLAELKEAYLSLAIIIIKISKRSVSLLPWVIHFFIEIGTPYFWAIVSPLYNIITLTKRNKKLSRDVIQCVHVLCRQNNNKQFQLFFCLPFPSASLKKALNHHDGSWVYMVCQRWWVQANSGKNGHGNH